MNEWVSVKDGLPEKSGEYLVYIKHHIFDDVYRDIIMIVGYSEKYKLFNASDFSKINDSAFTDVTHWMPLPEPPSIKKQETNKRNSNPEYKIYTNEQKEMENMTIEEIIKSCPLCGSEKIRLLSDGENGTYCVDIDEIEENIYAYVHCYECDTDFAPDTSSTPKDFLKIWYGRQAIMNNKEKEYETYIYEHKGYKLMQTSYNWHYMIIKDDTVCLHCSYENKLTEKQAKERIDLFLKLLNPLDGWEINNENKNS